MSGADFVRRRKNYPIRTVDLPPGQNHAEIARSGRLFPTIRAGRDRTERPHCVAVTLASSPGFGITREPLGIFRPGQGKRPLPGAPLGAARDTATPMSRP